MVKSTPRQWLAAQSTLPPLCLLLSLLLLLLSSLIMLLLSAVLLCFDELAWQVGFARVHMRLHNAFKC